MKWQFKEYLQILIAHKFDCHLFYPVRQDSRNFDIASLAGYLFFIILDSIGKQVGRFILELTGKQVSKFIFEPIVK